MKGTTRIVLTLAGMVVVAAAVAHFLALPMLKQADADRGAIWVRRAQLVKLDRVARRITDLQEEVKRLEQALAFFEDRLPQEREVDVILREVWVIAEAKFMTTRSVRTGAPETQARYCSQPITLALEGPFEGFYEFLLGLERLPRITKIRQMQVTKSPLKEGIVQAELLVDIFFEKSK
jgi:Tfp pilus assembly protein PilO